MSRKPRSRTVIGNRPAQAPIGWVIFNAPRPIYGHELWAGDFCSGVFYAAIDMSKGLDALRLLELNLQQDATILIFVPEEQVYQDGLLRLAAAYKGDTDALNIIFDPAQRGWILDNQLDYLNHSEVTK